MSDFLVDAKTGKYFWRDDLIKKHWRTALEWKTYWENRVERITTYRRNFNEKYVNNNLHKNAKNRLPI